MSEKSYNKKEKPMQRESKWTDKASQAYCQDYNILVHNVHMLTSLHMLPCKIWPKEDFFSP